MQPWSFNQPVLLNKSRRNRSVLVWTIAGATAFAGAWAFLAPAGFGIAGIEAHQQIAHRHAVALLHGPRSHQTIHGGLDLLHRSGRLQLALQGHGLR